MFYTVGIDPGKTGAMALLNSEGRSRGIWDWDDDLRSMVNHLKAISICGSVRLVVLEKAQAMPKQGCVSMFHYGTNFGMWQGLLAPMNWPTELISPQRWRKCLDSSVPAKPTKEDLRQYAIRRWPEEAENLRLHKYHGRAEALCMALFALSRIQGKI